VRHHRFQYAPTILAAIAIRIKDTGIASHSAGAPFAVSVTLSRLKTNSLGMGAVLLKGFKSTSPIG
jgi:hypothetical protein